MSEQQNLETALRLVTELEAEVAEISTQRDDAYGAIGKVATSLSLSELAGCDEIVPAIRQLIRERDEARALAVSLKDGAQIVNDGYEACDQEVGWPEEMPEGWQSKVEGWKINSAKGSQND